MKNYETVEVTYRSLFTPGVTSVAAVIEFRCRSGKLIKLIAEWDGAGDSEIIINALKDGRLMPNGWAEAHFKTAVSDVKQLVIDEMESHDIIY